jgi:class 3 adenylate cyclase/tetratricopeptide (TPR) repeat protein
LSISTGTAPPTRPVEWATAQSFIPAFLLRRLAQPEPLDVEHRSVLGAVLLTDVEAFTAQVERLVRQGPEGLDLVISGFNRYFCAVADAVHAHGGDILSNAGDSFFCWWPAESEQDLAGATALAGQAALAIQSAVTQQAPDSWPTRIGIAAGRIDLGIVGGLHGRWQLAPSGPAVAAVVACERLAESGTVLLAPEAAEALRDHAVLRDAPEHRAELKQLEITPNPTTSQPKPTADQLPRERLDPMVPAPVRRWGGADHAWLADFRRVNVVMAQLGSAQDSSPDIQRQHDAIRAFQEVVERFEGASKAQFDSKGMTLSAVFGLPPRAHRDDADRALQAAFEFAGQLESHGISSAVGVSSGRVCCGVFGNDSRREYTLFGDAVNLASRLSAAGSGEVLIDEDTFNAASLALEVERQRALAVKNRSEPVRVHRLLALREAEVQERELVGRQAERAAIDAALEQLVNHRRGSAIVIEGELGIGKSTLARYAARQATQANAQVLRVNATPIERGTAYRPWRPLIAGLLSDAAAPNLLAERLGAELRSKSLLPLLNPFLPHALPETPESRALTGEARSEQLNALLSLVLERVMQAHPTLLVVEDAQWFDSMSWELLDRIATEQPHCLALVTERIGDAEVELPPERDRLRNAIDTQVLTLSTLSTDDTMALVRERLGTDSVDPEVLDLVVERVTGHPFFCEALLEMLIQTGAIQVTSTGAQLGPKPDVGVPASIESAILGQLDRLAAPQQLTLKAAAVVGRTFRPEEVAAAHPAASDGDIPDQLDTLREVGLLAPGRSRERYTFWHQIIQEVAYGLLTESQRHQTHRALAEWYESQRLAALQNRPELMAHHWTQAGAPRRAAPYLELAGRNALHAGAFKEAIDLLTRAMDADPDVTPERRALQEKSLADARYFLGDLQGSRALLEQSLERLGHPIRTRRLPRAGDLLKGIATQTKHLALPRRYLGARQTEREELLPAADAFRVLVQISYLHGNSSLDLSSLIVRSLNLAELAGPSAELCRALANAAALTGLSGFHRQADRYAQRAIRLVEDEANSPAAAYVWNIVAILHAGRGWWDVALADNGRALELFGEVGDTRLESELWQTRAAVHLNRGSVEGAEVAWRRHRSLAEQTGSSANLCWSLLDEAQSAFFRGDAAACSRAVEGALAIPIFDSDGGTVLERRTSEALARLLEGNHAEAASHARAAINMLARSVPSGFHWAEFGALAVEVLLELRATRSRTVPERSLEQGTRRGIWALRRCAFTFGGLGTRLPVLRARAALLQEDRDQARRFVEQTLRRAERPDQRLDRARAQLVEAELTAEPHRRQAILAEACAILSELGQDRLLAQARERLQ